MLPAGRRRYEVQTWKFDPAIAQWPFLPVALAGEVFYVQYQSDSCLLADGKPKPNSGVLPSGDPPPLSSSLQLLSLFFPFPPPSMTAAAHANDFLEFIPTFPEALETYWCHFNM